MVMVVVFEFGAMRCQPLRRALCFRSDNLVVLHVISRGKYK
ncbi:acetyltransferase [Vibrio mimicus]